VAYLPNKVGGTGSTHTTFPSVLPLTSETHSSGVYSPHSFAVTVHMEPDILLVKEVLSVGDAKFKQGAAQDARPV
jgi:ABC-type polysaccharide/polyol phosphate transport system ATPase subunit